jgi:type IV pilus assembly protein PilW
MLAVLVIAQVALVYEGQKRSTTSGSDAQVNGALAMQTVQRDVQMGGYGATSGLGALAALANVPGLLGAGCPITARLAGTAAPNAPSLLVPVFIVNGAASAPDTVRLMASGQTGIAVPIGLAGDHAASDSIFTLRPNVNVGNSQGDLMLAVSAPAGGTPSCTLFTININGLGTPALINNGTGAVVNTAIDLGTPLIEAASASAPANAVVVGARLGHVADGSAAALWNGDGVTNLTSATYPAASTYLVNLGRPADFVYRSYRIGNGSLVLDSFSAQTGNVTTQELYPGIVDLQAVYGKALGANPQQVTQWNSADPALDTADSSGAVINGWSRVVALRIAVVARSQTFEKGLVTTTTNGPRWKPDGVNGTTFDLSTNPDWQHYRYKVYETVVPLRNMILQS